MTELKKLEAFIEHFWRQAKLDAEYSRRFMARLGEVARQAQCEHMRPASKGAKK